MSTVIVKVMYIVVWTLICKREDLCEVKSLVVFTITNLKDCGILIGCIKSCRQGQVNQSTPIGRRRLRLL